MKSEQRMIVNNKLLQQIAHIIILHPSLLQYTILFTASLALSHQNDNPELIVLYHLELLGAPGCVLQRRMQLTTS